MGFRVILAVCLMASAAVGQTEVETALALLRKQAGGVELSADEVALIDRAASNWRAVRAIRDRGRQGETLTPEERALVRRGNEIRQARAAEQRAAYRKANPPRASTGLVPLTALGKTLYKGVPGGLYGNGSNVPPDAHRKAGLRQAASVVPVDREGRPSADGVVVLLSQGMSNTTQEFQAFVALAADADVHPKVVLVDGAQGGQSADRTADPESNYWTGVDRRLAEANVTAPQVQVVWLKQATPRPTKPFPAEAEALKGHLLANLHLLMDRFPNLKIAYLSSRIYAGWAESPLNPEPHAYETAFSVKWLIEDQMAGRPELNFDPEKGPIRAPWIAWGPYLWADGEKARADGLRYAREDLAADGTHPSTSGRDKVGRQLLTFLTTDPTARPWFVP